MTSISEQTPLELGLTLVATFTLTPNSLEEAIHRIRYGLRSILVKAPAECTDRLLVAAVMEAAITLKARTPASMETDGATLAALP